MAINETNGISLRRLKTFLTNLKNIFAEKKHSHTTSDITGLDTALSSKATLAQGNKADSAVQSVKIGTTEYKSGTTVTLPSYPTSLPASDVPSWAKQKTKPTYTASEIGLGSVGNFKAVSTVQSQGLTDTEKSNARANIGAQVAGSYASSNHNHDDKYQAKGSYASTGHTHGNGDITSLDASKITSGTISIDRLPQGALERLTVVADDTARFKLTSTSVQKGDTVKVISTGKMYYVVDETKLSSEAGYEVYAAGTAASVPWSGVTGKPSTYTPSSHTHTKSQITDFPSSLPANGGNASTVNGHTINADVPSGAKFTDTNTWRGIQNNLTSDSTSDCLSAAQGKVLKGLVDSKVTESQNVATDLNNIKSTGIHHISASTSNNPTGTHGTLFAEFNVGTPYQIWLPDNSNTAYKRNYTTSTSTWGSWTQLKFTDTTYSTGTTSTAGLTKLYTTVGTATDGTMTQAAINAKFYDNGTSRTANTVLSAPNGSAGSATFRKLVMADLPIKQLTATQYAALSESEKKNGTIYLVN